MNLTFHVEAIDGRTRRWIELTSDRTLAPQDRVVVSKGPVDFVAGTLRPTGEPMLARGANAFEALLNLDLEIGDDR